MMRMRIKGPSFLIWVKVYSLFTKVINLVFGTLSENLSICRLVCCLADFHLKISSNFVRFRADYIGRGRYFNHTDVIDANERQILIA